MPLVMIGGGSRSGKSRYALELARRYGTRKHFVATAQPLDGEMGNRIRKHREERGTEFATIEEPLAIDEAVAAVHDQSDVVVIDCLTLWASNMMFAGREGQVCERINRLAALAVPVIAVTNEVGCGIVPENELARRFRDLAGTINQHAAAAAVEVWLIAFGVPLRLK